jgi:hypothetical protein
MKITDVKTIFRKLKITSSYVKELQSVEYIPHLGSSKNSIQFSDDEKLRRRFLAQ